MVVLPVRERASGSDGDADDAVKNGCNDDDDDDNYKYGQ